LAISDVTLQEVGLLVHSGRISFAGSPAAVLGSLHYVTVLPINLEITLAAPGLALTHGDQFDRIITATARVHRLVLITRDANITDAGAVETCW
jgi:PIN domain nuclease of toxin-antitoxin system